MAVIASPDVVCRDEAICKWVGKSILPVCRLFRFSESRFVSGILKRDHVALLTSAKKIGGQAVSIASRNDPRRIIEMACSYFF